MILNDIAGVTHYLITGQPPIALIGRTGCT